MKKVVEVRQISKYKFIVKYDNGYEETFLNCDPYPYIKELELNRRKKFKL